MKKETTKAAKLAEVIFDPKTMDARARDQSYFSPDCAATDLRLLQLKPYRRAAALLEVAADVLSAADGGWACESPTARTLEMLQATRKELKRATRETRATVAKLEKMRHWPKMRRTA